jgi:hypothetical protein
MYDVIAYLYVSLDSDIYMKVPDEIPVLNIHANRNMYCVKLVKSRLETIGKDLEQSIERVPPQQRLL